MSDFSLTINNKKIWDFYQKNSHLSFETMTLVFHDLIEKLLDDSSSAINSTINNQILNNVNETSNQVRDLKTAFQSLQTNISQLNNDITNNVVVRFMDVKKQYIDEIKTFVSLENVEKTDKIEGLLEKNNELLIQKTNSIIQDMIPSTENNYTKIIQETLLKFQQDLTNETKSLTNNDSIKEFISNFDTKCSTLMQNVNTPLYNCIASTEQRLQNDLDAIKQLNSGSVSKNETIMNDLNDYLKKFQNSSNKGQISENQLECVLTEMFPSGEIKNTANTKACGDFSVRRVQKPSVILENKAYNRNVNLDEVKKFIRDVEETKVHGIFLSQSSGITSKPNYCIDIHKGNILVYLHSVNYDREKIQVAFDIIDHLHEKIKSTYDNAGENTITQDVLDDINQEFQAFINQKDSLIQTAKDIQKKLVYQIEHMTFPALDRYLASKDYTSARKIEYVCELCNSYSAQTKKALSAHQRGCRKNHPAS